MKKKFKKLRKAIALSLALAVAATTNLGGLQNVVEVKASWQATTYTDSKGVDWKVLFDYDTNDNIQSYRACITNPLALENVDIEVPTSINGYEITEFEGYDSSYSSCKAKSITIPSGIEIVDKALNNCTFDTIYVNCEKFSLYNTKCNVKNIVFDGTQKIYVSKSEFNNLTSVTIKNTDQIEIRENAFDGCQTLENLNIENSVKKVVIGDKTFNSCIGLKDITIDAKYVTLNQAAFSNCTGLRNVTFNGYVTINALQIKYYCGVLFANNRNLGGVFHNSFGKEYDNNGNLIKKTLTFNDYVISKINGSSFSTGAGFARMEETGDYDDCDRYVIDNCPGLTDVIFNSGTNMGHTELTDNFFYNCENLTNIEFNVPTWLGNKIFKGVPVKKLVFQDQVSSLETRDLGNGSMTHNVDINPFDECQAKTLIFNNSLLAFTIANMPNLETLFFSSAYVGREGTSYGFAKPDYGIKLNNCDYLKTIIIYPDPSDLEYYSKNDTLNEMLKYFEIDLQKNAPTVYGYEFKDAIDNYIKTWARNNNLEFKNIISKLTVHYNDTIIGDNLTSSDIDTSKISVTAEFPNAVITDDTKDIFEANKNIPLESSGVENTGFSIDMLPETLEEGRNTFYISYSGIKEAGVINTEKVKAVSMTVNWNDTAISELVANQPITATTVASGATICYNNGTTDTISSEALVLDKTVTTLGDNIFTVSLKENQDIKESKTFSIKENYIIDIKAEYISNDKLYEGDKIDISKIKLTPTYKYNADETVNRNISATKISDTELKTGTNEIRVYYNDLETTMVVSAATVVPTKIYAMFDDNCAFYEGQEKIDPKSIVTTIEYNNGTKKVATAEEINCEIIQSTGTNVQVRVSYEGLESIVTIPVTAKEVVSIKANANIASATEGTTLAKTIIDNIEVTYSNGKTETLDASNIKYDELTFNDYAIVADTKNVITVNYLGKSTEITIVGISNTITSIFAEYIGSGQIVGTEIPVSDVAVHAVNSNGHITDITDGVLLENAIPYTVGANIVIVHYGSLSYIITVTGLPTATSEAGIIAPTATVVPTQTPKQTSQPSATQAPIPTQASTNSNVVVPTPDIANAPVVTNTTVTLKASNSKIVTATTNTYKVYTNKNVVITIDAVSASNIKYQIVAKGAKLSDTAWKNVIDNKITVSKTTKPCIVYIQYTDANGAVQTIHTNGFAVDKTKATANVKKNKTYKAGKKVTFKDPSGIKSAKLDGKKVKSGTKIKKKGTHTLVITDKAGNKTTIKFKVK